MLLFTKNKSGSNKSFKSKANFNMENKDNKEKSYIYDDNSKIQEEDNKNDLENNILD